MLITKSHQANEPVQVSIDKEELKLIPAVANHPSLSDEANWYMSSVIYKHVLGDARLAAGFKSDFTQTVDVPLKQNMVGGDVYELHEILVSGANRSPLISIKRSDIANASSMDLTLAGAFSGTYALWSNYVGNYSYTNDLVVQNNVTVEADGGIYGGGHGGDRVYASNITFAPNESGTFIYEVGNQLIDNIEFGFNFAEYSTLGFIFLNGKLRPNIDGDVPSTPNTDLNPSGTNICKIVKNANIDVKLYLNDVLFHTISLQNQWSWGTYPMRVSVRPSLSNSTNGILAAYKL